MIIRGKKRGEAGFGRRIGIGGCWNYSIIFI
jgi:hypothetical protein